MSDDGKPVDKNIRETLKEALDEAQWAWLAPHAERGALFVVSPELDLIDVGAKLVEDDSATVQGWLKGRKLSRPEPGQLKAWEAQPEMRFRFLIVQPYVLIQTRAH